MAPTVAILLCFACLASKIMAQKRLTDFFSSVSKRTRNEKEDKTVEELELNQKEKQDERDKQEVVKGKQVTTTLRKFRVEWKQLYPWLDYNDGKMFCLWCCEYGNLSNASSSFVTGGCTNFKIDTLRSHDISTGHDNVVKARCAQKNPAAAPLARAARIVSEEVQNKIKKLFQIAYFVAKLELPFTTYENLCGLEMKHGVDLGKLIAMTKLARTLY